MIISDKHTNQTKSFNDYIQAHFQEKFFIKPFTCPDCGNTHMLEKGILCVQTTYNVNNKDYDEGDKICDICATSIRNDIKKKWDYFNEKEKMILYHDRDYFSSTRYLYLEKESQ